MIDAGWPDSLNLLLNLLEQKNFRVSDIKYLAVTHFHPDHAGLVQNLKDFGSKLILHERQVAFVDRINDFFKKNPKYNFKEIVEGNNIVVSSTESRRLLKDLGVEGEIIQTPGHSDDSISLIIDECCAFTGDLPSSSLIGWDDSIKLKESWMAIQNHKVKKIYPGHGNAFTL
jgi:glyoxylase-like metal-dependent hydrolase (beta-lactamase superfamily II)